MSCQLRNVLHMKCSAPSKKSAKINGENKKIRGPGPHEKEKAWLKMKEIENEGKASRKSAKWSPHVTTHRRRVIGPRENNQMWRSEIIISPTSIRRNRRKSHQPISRNMKERRRKKEEISKWNRRLQKWKLRERNIEKKYQQWKWKSSPEREMKKS